MTIFLMDGIFQDLLVIPPIVNDAYMYSLAMQFEVRTIYGFYSLTDFECLFLKVLHC